MKKKDGQHAQPSRNDDNRKLIDPHGRLQVMNLRIQGQQRSGVKKEKRQTQKEENALKIALPSVAENHHHPEKLQQRPERVADKPDVDQRSHEPSACRILPPTYLQRNCQVPYFSCTT